MKYLVTLIMILSSLFAGYPYYDYNGYYYAPVQSNENYPRLLSIYPQGNFQSCSYNDGRFNDGIHFIPNYNVYYDEHRMIHLKAHQALAEGSFQSCSYNDGGFNDGIHFVPNYPRHYYEHKIVNKKSGRVVKRAYFQTSAHGSSFFENGIYFIEQYR